MWHELQSDKAEIGAFHLNGRWVPLYNLHKVLSGLLDVVELVGDDVAQAMLMDFGAWWLRVAAEIDGELFEQMLECEFGGMTEAFARLALHSGDVRYLHLARRFSRRALVEPLAAGRDELDALHANTQIPVAVGWASIERATRTLAPELLQDVADREGAAARNFFELVARQRSSAIGGDSVREHFPSGFASFFIAREGPESCNTYNMIKLASELYLLTEDDGYVAWAERARANHLRSTQHPEQGGLVYFTSHRPGHYRVYSPEAEGFWCCMGSGFEAQARHGSFAYSVVRSELHINALLPSQLLWEGLAIDIAIDDHADAAQIHVELKAHSSERRTIVVLVPAWVGAEASLSTDDGIGKTIHAGDRVRLEIGPEVATYQFVLPRRLMFEQPADGSDWAWFVDGPDVLAMRIVDDSLAYTGTPSRMGHIAVGALRPLADTPVLARDVLDHAVRVAPGRLKLPTADGDWVELEPFFAIHDARYVLSWPVPAEHGDIDTRRHELQVIDAASLSLEARTRDIIGFGEQQPESDHGLAASDDLIGARGDVRWRRTTGQIVVTLRDWTGTADVLQLTWHRNEEASGLRVLIDGRCVLEERVPAGAGYESRDIPLGPASGTIDVELRIEAIDGSTPQLRELRLLSAASDS